MTVEQNKLQDALNTAYFAFAANPANKTLAAAYDAARDALIDALDTPAHKALRAAAVAN
jgi:hypothetical protein